MSANLLERLSNSFGTPRAYDGRFCLWTDKGPFDVRDIARQLRVSPDSVTDALPDFKPAKRGRSTEEASDGN